MDLIYFWPNGQKYYSIFLQLLSTILFIITIMQSHFFSKLHDLGYTYPQSQETLCLENIRLNDKYLVFDLIAIGSHSAIYYGIEMASGQERAFKFYNLKQIQNEQSSTQKEVCKRLSNYEVQIMRKCNSIHILKCYDIFETRDYKIIVLEYCNMGSLAQQLSKKKSKMINQLQAILIIRHIISALKNLHKNTLRFHRNLKTKNVLIRNGIYKIIDFGLPYILSDNEEDNKNFLIPEIIQKKNYDQKAQVWNVGVLFHEILFGELPNALTYHNIKSNLISSTVSNILNKQGPYSQKVMSFLRSCLSTDPSLRMSWNQLQNHALFSQYSPPQLSSLTFTPTSLKKNNSNDMSVRISMILPIQQISETQKPSNSQQNDVGTLYEQKFFLEIEKREIQKQFEKTYIKLGYNLYFENIEPVSWKSLRQGINRQQFQNYLQLKRYYFQCLKVDFFYFEIIKVMKEFPSFERQRKNIQFLYLVMARCFFQMSQINILKAKMNELVFLEIKRQISTLYEEIIHLWNEYAQKLKKQQSKLFSILSDKFSRIKDKVCYKKKQLFFVAIEGKDYTKAEQIAYTMQFYSSQEIEDQLLVLLKEVMNRKKFQRNYERQQLLLKRVIKYLKLYTNIWSLSQDSSDYASLKEYIDREMLFEK